MTDITNTELQALRDAITDLKSRVSAFAIDTSQRLDALEQLLPADPIEPPDELSISDVTVAEGDDSTRTIQVIVTRQFPTTACEVSYTTQDGTAVAGQDYVAASGTLNFARDETTKSIQLTVMGDSTAEGDEQFSVKLLSATNGVNIVHGEAIVLIHDDDLPGTVSVADASVVEGLTGNALLTFRITRTGGSAPFTFDYTTSDGTAVAGSDYTAASGTLSFIRGQNEIALTVSVSGDAVVEANELMYLDIGNPTNRAVLGRTRAVGTIVNDDVELPPPPPPPPGSGLLLRLDFTDGKSLTFSQDQATDIGDYVGPFVHQKCFRQIASGNGDYRDAFLADLRTDADGSRAEAVIEFGSLFNLLPTGAIVTASGVAPQHLGIPPMPILVKIPTGNTSTQAGSLAICMTYITPDGETPASLASMNLAAGERVMVKSPPPAMKATGYLVYATLFGATPGNPIILQTPQPIPLGTDWTEPEAGVTLVGQQLVVTRPRTWAYKATLSGGTLAAPITETFPVHYWRSRARIHTGKRPIRRSLADLVTMKAVLPLDAKYAYGARPPAAVTWKGPMDNGPVVTHMGMGGGRNDLGFLTEWAAAFLVTGNAGAETSMWSAAEAGGTLAFWVRDAATGALVNTATTPKYPGFSDAFHGPQAIPSVPGDVTTWSYFYPQAAHMPPLGFVPYMLTDDPYYLEVAQATVNYSILESNLNRNGEKLKSLGSVATPRNWYWHMRDAFQMAGWAPEVVPSWLFPRSHYHDKVLADNLTYAMKYLNAVASPCTTVFGLIPMTTLIPAFMSYYGDVVFGWAKWTGKFGADWDKVTDYKARATLMMHDLNSPFHRYIPYYMPVYGAMDITAPSPPTPANYAVVANPLTPRNVDELWQACLRIVPLRRWPDPNQGPPDGLAHRDGYAPWWRSALATLSLAGLPKAREEHDWLAAQLDKDHDYSSNGFTWAIPPTQA